MTKIKYFAVSSNLNKTYKQQLSQFCISIKYYKNNTFNKCNVKKDFKNKHTFGKIEKNALVL